MLEHNTMYLARTDSKSGNFNLKAFSLAEDVAPQEPVASAATTVDWGDLI
jgi:hypothetical protein